MAALPGARVLMLCMHWWRTDDTLSLIQHQLVHFLRKWQVHVRLLYLNERRRLARGDEEEMRECGVDAVLCANCPSGHSGSPSPNYLCTHLRFYYEYIFQDAATFSDVTHIVAFPPDTAQAAIQLKAEFQRHYGRSVEVVLVNYRQLDIRMEEESRLVQLMRDQQWFSTCNISQVWSLGHTIFDHYSTEHLYSEDPAPHHLLLFRPNFKEIHVDLNRLRETHMLTVLPFYKSSTAETDRMNDVGNAVTEVHCRMFNQPRLQWTIATFYPNVVNGLVQNPHGRPTVKQLDPKVLSSRKDLLQELRKYRVYVSPSDDDSTFNMLDWMLIGSGMPVLVSGASCIGHTLEELGAIGSTYLPMWAVVDRAQSRTMAESWTKKISEVILNDNGQLAVGISKNLQKFIKENAFIRSIEQAFITSLHNPTVVVDEIIHQQSKGGGSMAIYPLELAMEVEPGEVSPTVNVLQGNPTPLHGNFLYTENVSEIEMRTVADQIPTDWQRLGTKLGISFQDQQLMSTPASGAPDQYAFKMLNIWRQRNSDMSYSMVKKMLVDKLRTVGRNDVAETVENSWPAQINQDIQLEGIFQTISGSLTRDWNDLRVYLDLPSDVAEQICAYQPLEEAPAKRMLTMWRKRTPHNQRAQLVNALKEMSRNDIAMLIGGPFPTAPSGGHTAPSGGHPTPSMVHLQDPMPHPPQFVRNAGDLQQSGRQPITEMDEIEDSSLHQHSNVEYGGPPGGPGRGTYPPLTRVVDTENSSLHSPSSIGAPGGLRQSGQQPMTEMAETEDASLYQHSNVEDLSPPASFAVPSAEVEPTQDRPPPNPYMTTEGATSL